MQNTINIDNGNVIDKETRKKLMNIFINRLDIDKRFLDKDFNDLSWDELDFLFQKFEDNFWKFKDVFIWDSKQLRSNLEQLKTRKRWKCGMNINQYKRYLIEELWLRKTKEIANLVWENIFQTIYLELNKEKKLKIFAYINPQTLAEKLKNFKPNEIKKFCKIINWIQDSEKAITFAKTIFWEYNNILQTTDEDILILTINSLNNEDISDFFKYWNKDLDIITNINDKEKFFIIYEDFHNYITKSLNWQRKSFDIAEEKTTKEKKYTINQSGISTKQKDKFWMAIFFEILKIIDTKSLAYLINRTIPIETSSRLQQDIFPKQSFEEIRNQIRKKDELLKTNLEEIIFELNKNWKRKSSKDKERKKTIK